MRRIQLARAISGASFAQVAAIVAGVASQLILARALGASERGRLGFQMALVFLGSQTLLVGLQWGLAVEVAQRRVNALAAVQAGFLRSILAGFVFFAAGITVQPFLQGGMRISLPELLFGAIAVSGTAMMSIATGTANATLRLREFNTAIVLWRLVPAVAYLSLWHLGGISVGAAIVTNAIASWSAAVFTLQRTVPFGPMSLASVRGATRQAGAGSLRALRSNGLVYLQQRIDVLIASGLLPPQASGTYAVLAASAELAVAPAQAIANVLFAAVASGARALADDGVQRTLRAAFWLGLLVGGLYAATVPLMLPVLAGESFGEWTSAIAFAPGIAAAYSGVVLHALHTVRGYPAVCSVAPAAGIAVTLITVLPLVEAYGAMGLAAAASLGLIIRATLLARALRRLRGAIGEAEAISTSHGSSDA